MANSEHVNIIKQGTDVWNKWRQENPSVTPDLAWANLIGLKLENINLSNANMKLAFCKTSDFTNADLSGANLYGTNFQDSVLRSANMKNADLEGANLINADLDSADLEGANLKLAVFDGANCKNINLVNTKKLKSDQLSGVSGLSGARLESSVLDKIRDSNPDILSGDK